MSQIRALQNLLALAKDPFHNSKKYGRMSFWFSAIGAGLLIQTLFAFLDDYEPKSHLVYCAVAGVFFCGLGIYFNQVKLSSEFLSPFLNKELIEEKIDETNT